MQVYDGQLLAGKYRVERELGRGGMGVVVAAHHLQLDEKVAIKFLLPEALIDAEGVERFLREARAAVRIKSEHVARVSDVGNMEGGEPYMVMEYLEGLDLAAWLQQYGALPGEQAVEFVLQASEAIAEAHALGIVHRDLKLANLFVVRRADGLWSVKVLDFGISKVSTPGAPGSDANLTRTAAVMGSPLYMPPEQLVASKSVDGRADIWALGVILYELIAGQPPFTGDTLTEVCSKIALQPPRDIREFHPGVPPALEAVILRCLEKDRERRYPNIAELAHALVAFGPPRARSSVDRIARTIEAAGLSGRPPALSEHHDSVAPVGKGGRAALALGAVLVLALAGLAVGAKHPFSSPEGAGVAGAVSVAQTRSEPVILPAPPTAVRPVLPAATVEPLPTKPEGPGASPQPVKHSPSMTHVPRPTRNPNIFDDR
jgi:serine/threonine-protein kinase